MEIGSLSTIRTNVAQNEIQFDTRNKNEWETIILSFGTIGNKMRLNLTKIKALLYESS